MPHVPEPRTIDLTPTREGYAQMLRVIISSVMPTTGRHDWALKELYLLAAGARYNGEPMHPQEES